MFLGNVSEGTLTASEHVPFVRALVAPKLLVGEGQIRTSTKAKTENSCLLTLLWWRLSLWSVSSGMKYSKNILSVLFKVLFLILKPSSKQMHDDIPPKVRSISSAAYAISSIHTQAIGGMGLISSLGGRWDIFPLLHIDNLKTWLHGAYLKVITEGVGKQRKG